MSSHSGETLPTQNTALLLENAGYAFDDLMDSEEFTDYCAQPGRQIEARVGYLDPIDPRNSFNPRAYAYAIADYDQEQRATNPRHDQPPMEAALEELTISTPRMALDQDALYSKSLPDEERFSARTRLGHWHELLRTVMQGMPNENFDLLQLHLIGAIEKISLGREVQYPVDRMVAEHMRGVRNELAFEKMAKAIGRNIRKATVAEDGAGADYFYNETPIDIKSSTNKIDALLGQASQEVPYAIDWNGGRIVAFLLLREQDFGGKLSISDKLAQDRGAMLFQYLDRAVKQLRHPNIYRPRSAYGS